VARFVLQPCKLRENRLVPLKNTAPVEFTWKELVERLAPSRTDKALKSLYFLQPGSFVGLLKHPNPRKREKEVVNFVYVGQGRTGLLLGPMAQDPTFAERLIEVYRVEKAEKDMKMSEPEGVVHGPTVAG
jgi:hypothetical protein